MLRPPAGHPHAAKLGTCSCPPPPSPAQGVPTTEDRPSGRSTRAPPWLILVVAARCDPEQVLGATATHLYRPPHGAAPVSRPPLPVTEAQDEVHNFLWNREVTTIYEST